MRKAHLPLGASCGPGGRKRTTTGALVDQSEDGKGVVKKNDLDNSEMLFKYAAS